MDDKMGKGKRLKRWEKPKGVHITPNYEESGTGFRHGKEQSNFNLDVILEKAQHPVMLAFSTQTNTNVFTFVLFFAWIIFIIIVVVDSGKQALMAYNMRLGLPSPFPIMWLMRVAYAYLA